MIELLLLLIPAGVANLLPPLFVNLKEEWNWPVDMGKTFRRRRILGDHKTFKGFIVGMIGGGISFLILKKVGLINFDLPWYMGVLLGFAALGADSVKSFFKRQFDVQPGKSWFPWDQIDWLIGSLALLAFYVPLEWQTIIIALLVGLVAHLITKVIGYILKVNKSAI